LILKFSKIIHKNILANNIDYDILFTKLLKSYSNNVRNNSLYNKIINHNIINTNEIRVTETTGMGIVFIMHYLFFFGDEEYNGLIRQTLYN